MRTIQSYLACLVVVFLINTAVQAATTDSVPTSMDIQVRNGAIVPKGEYPQAVVIQMDKDGKPVGLCSGVILTSIDVLTAAHCGFNGTTPTRVTAGSSFSEQLPLNGSSYARRPTVGQPAVQTVAVERFWFMNDEAVQRQAIDGVDLMLIRLKAPFVEPVQPITIPSLDNINAAQLIRVVGFGDNGSRKVGQKLFADIRVLVPRCDPSAGNGPETFCAQGAELFAKDIAGVFDTCPGDSGGPVYVRNKGGMYKLIGISSRAPMPSMKCGGGTFVTLLDGPRLDWIKSRINIDAPRGSLTPEAPPPQRSNACPTCPIM